MNKQNKLKILNDPIYGFITIPSEDVYNLIEHPYFQRLRRITQMGLSYLVYPGANHTRFHHALGCMHLMQKAVQVLRSKQVTISIEEEDALYKTILLHDIGHGPFSHAMEHCILNEVSHEQLSLRIMQELNAEFDGRLDLAIKIFKGKYHRPFMLQLVSSQLDMDRLDYLKRDSFYTGVSEGNINSQRLISMLNVKNDVLVVEEKGVYSVETFLVGRRLMYWQVYLHKTSVGAEHLFQSIFTRIKELLASGTSVQLNAPMDFFMNRTLSYEQFEGDVINKFLLLDDIDLISVVKQGRFHRDFVLSELCNMLLDRKLLKIKFKNKPFSPIKKENHILKLCSTYDISEHEASYFVFNGQVSNLAYDKNQPIQIVKKSGKITDLLSSSDKVSLDALTTKVEKYYLCFPKMQD